MYQRILALTLTGAGLCLGASLSQASCIEISDLSLFPNDVSIDHCVPSAPGYTSCDMNGIQGKYATHGTAAVGETMAIASWTRNTLEVTEEYVCTIDLPDGIGDGAVHQFSGMGGVAKDYLTFRCRYTPNNCQD